MGPAWLQIPPDLRAEMDIGDRVTLERADGGILIRPAAGSGSGALPANLGSDATEDEPLPTRRTRLGGWMERARRRM